ncbi:MAG: class I SAM-dependent methyltransferase [Chloroflexia bacterium]|nr:class I SAM-dependent methyltransferase [Chloroflexia bacterium]
MDTTPPTVEGRLDGDLEAEIAARIEPWLQHMYWRSDFEAWRQRRLYQERYQGEKLSSVRACLGPPAGRPVLDVGAGMGGFAVALAREGARVTALEFNPAYGPIIRLRGRRYGLELPVARGAGERLPFPPAQFDLVCAWDVLEHVQEPQAVLQEAWRVLRPEGAFLLTVINRWAFRDPHYHLPFLNWLPRPWAEAWIRRARRGKQDSAFADRQDLSDMHYFRFGRFAQMAEAAGFRVEDLQERRLRQGSLSSRRPVRRALRRILRPLGLEVPAYRLARSLVLSFYEVVLWKS